MQMELDAIEEEFSKKECDIDNEFLGKISVLNGNITELEAEIKQDVLHIGSTVKGSFLMAVWNKARETVDMKQLKVYAVAHPEVNSMIKTGEPTVTIRKNGKGE
jgi:hypothetical protein